jgi:hypothetical protein
MALKSCGRLYALCVLVSVGVCCFVQLLIADTGETCVFKIPCFHCCNLTNLHSESILLHIVGP